MALLENIRVFIRVAELGSLSAAGRDMRLSPAVASHRMKELEKHLGVRLFNRTTRALQLTEQGQQYYDGCLEALHALDQAEAAVAAVGGHPRGALRITVPLGFGRRVLAPLLPQFRAAYPEIELRLRLSDHLVDLMREGIDAAIRIAPLDDSSMTMRKICDVPRALVASPAYLAAHGAPKTPLDLLRHECLLLRYPGSTQYQWTLTTPEGPLRLSVRGSMDADDGDILTDWAMSGVGITLKPLFEVAGALRTGELVQVLPEFPPVPATMALLYPHRRLIAPKVKVFADFIVDALRREVSKLMQG